MNRRAFLQTTGSIMGVGLISGGLYIRHRYMVDNLAREMVEETLPFVKELWQAELKTVPETAREEVRQFFHLKCLNVDHFLQVLTGHDVQAEIRSARKDPEREEIIMREFCQHVVSGDEIKDHLTKLAGRLGKSLDDSWANSCREISQQWSNQHGVSYASDYEILSLRTRESMIKHLRASAKSFRGEQELALEQNFTEVGRAALLLIPLKKIGKASARVAVPSYFVEAVRPHCSYLGQLAASNSRKSLEQMTTKLSELGNHIGAECEKVMFQKVHHLHTVRHISLMEVARNIAQQQIQYI